MIGQTNWKGNKSALLSSNSWRRIYDILLGISNRIFDFFLRPNFDGMEKLVYDQPNTKGVITDN